jgi:hypothetical protein
MMFLASSLSLGRMTRYSPSSLISRMTPSALTTWSSAHRLPSGSLRAGVEQRDRRERVSVTARGGS